MIKEKNAQNKRRHFEELKKKEKANLDSIERAWNLFGAAGLFCISFLSSIS
jgi:hypothetical protein